MKWSTEDSLSAARTKKIKFRHGWIAVLVLLAMTTGCTLLPTEDKIEVVPIIDPPKLSKKPEYKVASAKLEQKIQASGKLMSLEEAELYFLSDNYRIQAIHVKVGDEVKKGQVIAELETDDLESEIKLKDIQLQKSELQMMDKLRNMTEDNETAVKLEQLELQIQREEFNKLKQKMVKAKITAPFAGKITYVAKQEGDMEKAYETIAIISNPAKLTAVARFGTDDLKSVTVGMEAILDINTVGQFKGKVVKLPVDEADQSEASQTIDDYVVIQVDNLPQGLEDNNPLSASIITESKANAVQIPPAALRTQGGRNYVLVIDNEGNKSEVDVEIGLTTATAVEIIKGLTPGQKVVGK